MFDIKNNLFVGILGLKYPRSKGVNLSKRNINKYLGIPNELIVPFYFEPCKSQNIKEKYHNSLVNHMYIVRYAYEKGYPYALIFEDDIEFKEFDKMVDIKKIFYSSLDEMTQIDNLDKLNFAESFVPTIRVSKHIYKTDHTSNVHMYILSRKGMKKIIDSYYPKKFTDDHLSLSKFGTLNQFDFRYEIYLNSYISSPPISYQRQNPGILKELGFTDSHHKLSTLFFSIGKCYIYLVLIGLLFISLFFTNFRRPLFIFFGVIFLIILLVFFFFNVINHLKFY